MTGLTGALCALHALRVQVDVASVVWPVWVHYCTALDRFTVRTVGLSVMQLVFAVQLSCVRCLYVEDFSSHFRRCT